MALADTSAELAQPSVIQLVPTLPRRDVAPPTGWADVQIRCAAVITWILLAAMLFEIALMQAVITTQSEGTRRKDLPSSSENVTQSL
jgi:hypothetical protein